MSLNITTGTEHGFDAKALRGALGQFATGVTVMTAQDSCGRRVGVTANSFSSVSLDPPLVLWSIGKQSGSAATFCAASHYGVNILSASQVALSNHFASRVDDKYAGITFEDGEGGCALLAEVTAHFECALERCIDGGDHWILLGRVLRFRAFDRPPLLFHQGRYAALQAVA